MLSDLFVQDGKQHLIAGVDRAQAVLIHLASTLLYFLLFFLEAPFSVFVWVCVVVFKSLTGVIIIMKFSNSNTFLSIAPLLFLPPPSLVFL